MNTVDIRLPGASYSILIAHGLLNGDAAATAALRACVASRRCLVVTDSHVEPLYAEAATRLLESAGAAAVQRCAFPAGECSKTMGTLETLTRTAAGAGLDRHSVVVALGGGVVGDVAGFLAAVYMRGVACVQVPTTLLAMVDSSVGGKVAVDLPEGKNLVGAFHQPRLVLADLGTLATLPPREWRCGLAEVVKYGIIMDAPFFAMLEAQADHLTAPPPELLAEVVTRCCQLKAQVVENDEREQGRRAILNYGHTFGHALESATGFALLNHGEAVAIGMGMAADLAVRLGLATADVPRRQDALLRRCGLPVRLGPEFAPTAEDVLERMHADKKVANGRLRLVLPRRIGHVELIECNDRERLRAVIGGRHDQH